MSEMNEMKEMNLTQKRLDDLCFFAFLTFFVNLPFQKSKVKKEKGTAPQSAHSVLTLSLSLSGTFFLVNSRVEGIDPFYHSPNRKAIHLVVFLPLTLLTCLTCFFLLLCACWLSRTRTRTRTLALALFTHHYLAQAPAQSQPQPSVKQSSFPPVPLPPPLSFFPSFFPSFLPFIPSLT